MEEIWRPVLGYEGYYEVSNLGNVRSVDRTVICDDGSIRTIKGKDRVKQFDYHGYPFVSLYKGAKGKNHHIHRLVAIAFIPNPGNKPTVDHIDRNPKNNTVENLRWCTLRENVMNPLSVEYRREHLYIEETFEKAKRTKIKRNCINRERKVFMFSMDGELLATFNSATIASRETGINATTIRNACRRARGGKSAGGYLWSRDEPSCPRYDAYESKQKSVYQYDENGNFLKEWPSVKDAGKAYNVKNISRAARGAKKCKCAGFWWRYYKTDNIFKSV